MSICSSRIHPMHSPALVSIFLVCLSVADGQISSLFGKAEKTNNCAIWTNWGPCIWLKGGTERWTRSYFDQLLPGRHGCRDHPFFKLIRRRWGTAFDNFFSYLREITLDERPCGKCSYQQSCGRKCHRHGSKNEVNQFFVAERLCSPRQIQGNEQTEACVSKQVDQGCQLWPNPDVQLPNVTVTLRELIDDLGYLSCRRQKKDSGYVCRCCCHPFEPNPLTFVCQLKKGWENSDFF